MHEWKTYVDAGIRHVRHKSHQMTKYSCRNEPKCVRPKMLCHLFWLTLNNVMHGDGKRHFKKMPKQTGDISHRYDLNVHLYWNPCTSVSGWTESAVQQQKCNVYAVAPLRIECFFFHFRCSVGAQSRWPAVDVAVLNAKHLPFETVRMWVHLIYWYAWWRYAWWCFDMIVCMRLQFKCRAPVYDLLLELNQTEPKWCKPNQIVVQVWMQILFKFK